MKATSPVGLDPFAHRETQHDSAREKTGRTIEQAAGLQRRNRPFGLMLNPRPSRGVP